MGLANHVAYQLEKDKLITFLLTTRARSYALASLSLVTHGSRDDDSTIEVEKLIVLGVEIYCVNL